VSAATPAEAQELALLARRAARLAMPLQADSLDDDPQVLAFQVAGRSCGIALPWLREVRMLPECVALPHPIAHLMGIVHLRGTMLPVLDLAALLGLAAAAAPTRLVVLAHEGLACGLAVEAIDGLRTVQPDEVQRHTAPLAGLHPGAVQGLAADGLLLLAPLALLAHLRPAS
jgi:purine-binding chemotaxis protein CheW